MTPAGTSNELDVQNEWEENTHTHTYINTGTSTRIFFPLTGGCSEGLGPFRFIFIHGVCVCVFSSHLFWTSSSLDVPAGVTQEEGHTGFLIHLPSAVRAFVFLARRIQPFLSLVDREVEFCVLTI